MTTLAYVSNADSGDISVLRLDARGGRLTPLQTVQAGAMVMPLAVSPDRRFLYAARRSEPFSVACLRIERPQGRLALFGEAPLPASMAYIATDRTGRFLLSASYPGNLVAVSPIRADGLVQPAQQVIATGPHAHAIQADPSNRHVFAAVLGADQVLQLRFDAATGRLEPNAPPALQTRPGAGPRHFVFHPGGRLVYLLHELDATIDVLALDAERGTLAPVQTASTLPPGFAGPPWAADLHLTPDGRFLYASERRSSTLAAFHVDADGALSGLRHVPTQAQPRGFAIDPSGRFLVAAGQLSHRIGLHAIDPDSGALAALHEVEVGRNPNWVEIIDLA